MRVDRITWGRTVVMFAVLALLVAACSGGATTTPGTSAEATPVASTPGRPPLCRRRPLGR